jgi:hypothetical protein
MAFDGTEGGEIDLKQAAAWIANYRERTDDPTRAVFYGRDILQRILGQDGCVGIRFYHARNDEGVHQLVLVGVNAEGEDQTEGTIADDGKTCPPICSINSELMQ